MFKDFLYDLQLFADGAATAGADVADGADGADGSTGDTSDQAAADDGTKGTERADNKPSFEDLIKGDYKDAYDAEVQKIVKGRIKENKDFQKKFETLSPAIEALAKKYGIDGSDSNALAKAVLDDDTLYEQRALDEGIPIDTAKKLVQLERDAAELEKIRQTQEQEQANREKWDKLVNDSSNVKNLYPNFNLETEITTNDRFARFVAAGVTPLDAYEATHIQEIRNGLLKTGIQEGQKKIANAIAANGKRPTENGVTGNSAASTTKIDVNNLTHEQLVEIRKRHERGEAISFG